MPSLYTVRLGFKALANDRSGERLFDVKLQDSVVLKNFDIFKTAGKANKAVVKEFKGIPVENALALELVSKSPDPDIKEAPIINFVEVIREDTGR